MVMIIRNMDTGHEVTLEGFYEMYTDAENINITTRHEGKLRHHIFSKKDYEIRYLG